MIIPIIGSIRSLPLIARLTSSSIRLSEKLIMCQNLRPPKFQRDRTNQPICNGKITCEVSFKYRLEEEFRSDPWLTHKFHKHTASPKRWAYKNSREIKWQYRFTFLVNFCVGGVLSWPLAVIIGRRMKRTQGGVPAYPLQRLVHDFANVEPTWWARKTFNQGFRATIVVGGFLFAYFTTDTRILQNPWYNRPDLKPFPAMVPQDKDDITSKTSLYAHY